MKKLNNLKELKQLLPVASARRNNNYAVVGDRKYYFNLRSEIYPEFTPTVMKIIKGYYWETISYNKSRINSTFTKVYGRPLKTNLSLSDLIIKMKEIMQQTGASLEQIKEDIQRYLGYRASFFMDNERKVVVPHERVVQAHRQVKERKSIVEIENTLYL